MGGCKGTLHTQHSLWEQPRGTWRKQAEVGAADIGVGESKFLGGAKYFARISPNLPENSGNSLCEYFLPDLQKKFSFNSAHVRRQLFKIKQRWTPFFPVFSGSLTQISRYFANIFIYFAQIFTDFRQIKTSGERLHPTPHWPQTTRDTPHRKRVQMKLIFFNCQNNYLI